MCFSIGSKEFVILLDGYVFCLEFEDSNESTLTALKMLMRLRHTSTTPIKYSEHSDQWSERNYPLCNLIIRSALYRRRTLRRCTP